MTDSCLVSQHLETKWDYRHYLLARSQFDADAVSIFCSSVNLSCEYRKKLLFFVPNVYNDGAKGADKQYYRPS